MNGGLKKQTLVEKIKINGSYQIASKLSVYGGVSMNVHLSKVQDAEGEPEGSLLQKLNSFYDKVHRDMQVIIYPGFNIGLRF